MYPMNRALSTPCRKVILLCLKHRRNSVPASAVSTITHPSLFLLR
jgi:hypothetical protein